jgi:hypothetical protein
MSSTDLTPHASDMPAVVDPVTGEALVLADVPTDSLALFLSNAREIDSTLREQKKAVGREILARMDKEAKWSAALGDWNVKGDGPTKPTEYDAEQLYEALGEFVDAGVITEAAREDAVERTYAYKAKHRGIQALTKLGGGVAEVIRAHSREVEKDRRVSVSRRTS